MQNPKTILITGASSGLGKALAEEYAASGITLLLTGRNTQRLAEVATLCQTKGATVITCTIDVTDKPTFANFLTQHPIDLAIANAGISAGTGAGGETEQQIHDIFAINLQGVLNTIGPLIEPMKQRGRGQLALMSSLASLRGFPGAPAYCASKAAVRVYGEALRGDLAPHNIHVNVICPGFVKTPMTDINTFPMPFLMEPEKAARIIRQALSANKPRIAFPLRLYGLIRLLLALPVCLSDRILAKTPRKPSRG